MELDIYNLKKIKGDLYELKRVDKAAVIRHKEDCQNHIVRINQSIEEYEWKKKEYEDIEVINKLLAKE